MSFLDDIDGDAGRIIDDAGDMVDAGADIVSTTGEDIVNGIDGGNPNDIEPHWSGPGN